MRWFWFANEVRYPDLRPHILGEETLGGEATQARADAEHTFRPGPDTRVPSEAELVETPEGRRALYDWRVGDDGQREEFDRRDTRETNEADVEALAEDGDGRAQQLVARGLPEDDVSRFLREDAELAVREAEVFPLVDPQVVDTLSQAIPRLPASPVLTENEVGILRACVALATTKLRGRGAVDHGRRVGDPDRWETLANSAAAVLDE